MWLTIKIIRSGEFPLQGYFPAPTLDLGRTFWWGSLAAGTLVFVDNGVVIGRLTGGRASGEGNYLTRNRVYVVALFNLQIQICVSNITV